MKKSDNNPLNEFSGCHEGIIKNFETLAELVNIYARNSSDPKLESMAGELLQFFKSVVLEHHAEEEEELFTAVMKSAKGDEETKAAQEAIIQLTNEHRELEKMWSSIETDLRLMAKGKRTNLDEFVAKLLSSKYLEHAQYEEQVFLPLSAKILSRNDMSALGMSLHMRHIKDDFVPFI